MLIIAAVASLLGFPMLAGAAATGARLLIGVVLVLFLRCCSGWSSLSERKQSALPLAIRRRFRHIGANALELGEAIPLRCIGLLQEPRNWPRLRLSPR